MYTPSLQGLCALSRGGILCKPGHTSELRGLCVLCARSSLQSSEMTSSWEGSWAPGSRGRECGLAGEGPGYCPDAAHVPVSSQDGTNLKMNTPSLTKPSCAHQTCRHTHTCTHSSAGNTLTHTHAYMLQCTCEHVHTVLHNMCTHSVTPRTHPHSQEDRTGSCSLVVVPVSYFQQLAFIYVLL